MNPLKKIDWTHEKNLWLNHFRSQSTWLKVSPWISLIAYVILFAGFSHFRFDHWVVAIVGLILWFGGPRTLPAFRFMLPLLLVFVSYDSMRIYADLIRGPIRVEEPYLFDRFFFGIQTESGVLTPNEWWQIHTHPILDVFCGFFYLTFIFIYVVLSGFFAYKLPAHKRTIPMWSFFWVNILGYTTYYWYPAAPPWYVAMYGLGPADLSAVANPAGALRFDEVLGTSFFTAMYSRSADVFGAIPSLHIAYPLQSVYYAFQNGYLRTFSVFFFLSMCFSAVYLNHHYLLDIIWGAVYALLTCWVVDWYYRKRAST